MDKTEFLKMCQAFAHENQSYEVGEVLRGQKKEAGTAFYAAWTSGGESGGDCYGGKARPYTSDTPEAEFDALDKFLEAFFPDITYLTFRKMERKVERDTHNGYGDYYGNCVNYAFKKLAFEDVWDALEEAGLV